MSETRLSGRAAEHLENLQLIEPNRRPIDGPGRIMHARDALFCVATNLECQPPQHQPGMAERLRAIADLLVELDAMATDLGTLRAQLRFAVLPQAKRGRTEWLIEALERLAEPRAPRRTPPRAPGATP